MTEADGGNWMLFSAFEMMLVFLPALAFAWWELRSLKRLREARERQECERNGRPPDAGGSTGGSTGGSAGETRP
ncbi:hypothetical protein [Prosthecomicrobium hirschii]|uniref:hypothetical protein n=1 Tax=Prosthecodimorpha hirschii TaxID=665126 RepID=UPI00221ED9DA|nr:hypothetical protein [Prosthecomicrobium hirschii]MCW1842502.1 hypothetical protein [Prosthecomicrobium hirschii]